MGGASASDDLEMGHLTQTWLAISDDPAATVSGRYWYHRRQQRPAEEVSDPRFQDQLVAALADLTGVSPFQQLFIRGILMVYAEWRSMRVTVSHNRRKEEIMRALDRSFDDLFKGLGTVPLQIVNESRKWTGSRMDFSFDAKMGIVSTPIKGFVEVTDKDVTVDADLGWLERLIPAKQTQAAIEGRVKGLLT
jgi:hypothetical protein